MAKKFSKYVAPSLKDARLRTKQTVNEISYSLDPKYQNLGRGKTYIMKTYGCQGNLADSEMISGIMTSLSYEEVYTEEEADVIIFNTCAIREKAETRIYGELGRLKGLKEKNEGLLIVLCGCMPQEEVTVEKIKTTYRQVDIMFGTHNIYKLPQYLDEAYNQKQRVLEVYSIEGDIIEGLPMKRSSRKQAWVTIMYGCDEFCSFCIVPYTRGKERSRRKEDIISEVKELVKQGYIEITLLGQNVNAYGNDFVDCDYTFGNLLEDLAKTNIPRIRYTTSHPRDMDEKTMQMMAKYDNIMPHLHLPVQSGSDKVLRRMNRRYTKKMYLDKMSRLRELVPHLSLTTDLIVGFPGETEEDFLETLDLVEKADFEGAFTFIYSPRKGTPAARYKEQIDPKVAKDRLLRLNEKINEGFEKGCNRFDGKIVEILVCGYSQNKSKLLFGYTKNNKLVNFEGDESLIGKLIKVKIIKAYTWHLLGEYKKSVQ